MNNKTNNAYAGYADSITVMSFDEYEDIRDRMNERRKQRINKDRERRALYYRQQRLMGAIIMIVGIACLITGCCITAKILEYFGIFAAVVGLYIVVTPQMILVNKYYLERKDKLNEY